jgi:hypothetical protein
MAVTGKGTTHRKHRLERGFMVQLPGRKLGPLPGNLLVRQIIPVATSSREINPALALRERPISSRAIIREQIGICASNAPAQRKGMPRGLTTNGQNRI